MGVIRIWGDGRGLGRGLVTKITLYFRLLSIALSTVINFCGLFSPEVTAAVLVESTFSLDLLLIPKNENPAKEAMAENTTFPAFNFVKKFMFSQHAIKEYVNCS